MAVYHDGNNLKTLSRDQTLWVYNGLDCIFTDEIYDIQKDKLREADTQITYNFERGMLGPALCMMLRGFKVNEEKRRTWVERLEKRLYKLTGMKKDEKGRWQIVDEDALIQKVARDKLGTTLNINSVVQLKKAFYETLRIEEMYKLEKGVRKVSCDRDALERIKIMYPRGRKLAQGILLARDLEKTIQVLRAELTPDGRYTTSFNIAGTETGRWSSSEGAFWIGGNIQNIRKSLRRVFIPDDGYRLFYADLQSAESVAVAYLSGDENYKKAVAAGDIHTQVAKMIWSDMGWTGDPKADRKIAEQPYYRHYSYRDICKRGGHGTNYYGKPAALARQLKVQQYLMAVFQALYYGGELLLSDLKRWRQEAILDKADEIVGVGSERMAIFKGAFPRIREWHSEIAEQLQTVGYLTTPLGRRRQFYGRSWDDATLREAIAYIPQSTIGDILNIGLYRVWRNLDTVFGGEVQILAQVHDAIVGQVPIGLEEELAPKIVECMTIEVPVLGETMCIGTDINFGNNWKEAS